MVLHFNYNCQLCKQNFNHCVALTAHLKFKHKNEMSYETYYLKYNLQIFDILCYFFL